ncbi:MAG TPA: AMP-binding protein, partial [Terrimesophilobacter sp.]|nr:AMP-binding protein [Terrimesophilobacter sp.]
MTDSPELSVLLHETKRFDPPGWLAETANAQPEIYERAAKDRLGYWAEQAEFLTWDKKWDEVLQWDLPHAKWFVGGTLNASVNCVDRHVDAGNGDRVAFHWIGEPEGDTRDITYRQLKDEVSKTANALISLGVKKGDRIAIYMPMIPETVFAMLACARLGAPHMVVFAGYSSEALSTR